MQKECKLPCMCAACVTECRLKEQPLQLPLRTGPSWVLCELVNKMAFVQLLMTKLSTVSGAHRKVWEQNSLHAAAPQSDGSA